MDNFGPIAFSAMLGIGLAAACGLRVFMPLFITSVFTHFDLGGFGLHQGFEWIGAWPAMIAFGTATIVEVLSYYVPFVDHVLDVVAVPLSTIAGTVVALNAFAEFPPLFAWGAALIAGGGIAGLISAGVAATRLASSGTTAGFGNHVVSTAETGGSIALSLLAWFVPVLAILLVVALLYFAIRVLTKVRRIFVN